MPGPLPLDRNRYGARLALPTNSGTLQMALRMSAALLCFLCVKVISSAEKKCCVIKGTSELVESLVQKLNSSLRVQIVHFVHLFWDAVLGTELRESFLGMLYTWHFDQIMTWRVYGVLSDLAWPDEEATESECNAVCLTFTTAALAGIFGATAFVTLFALACDSSSSWIKTVLSR